MRLCNTFNPQFSTGSPRLLSSITAPYPRGLWTTGISIVDPQRGPLRRLRLVRALRVTLLVSRPITIASPPITAHYSVSQPSTRYRWRAWIVASLRWITSWLGAFWPASRRAAVTASRFVSCAATGVSDPSVTTAQPPTAGRT
jgi:hypothetical protein